MQTYPGRSLLPLFFALLLEALFLYPNAHAQSAKPARNEFGIFGIIPVGNLNVPDIAIDRHFFLAGLSYRRLLAHGSKCDLHWTSEIMPVEFLAEPFRKGTNVQVLAAASPLTQTKVTYGVGSNPIGADLFFLPGRRWQPFTGVHGGLSYFTRNVLASRASQFNFMIDGRGGVRFPLHKGQSLAVAYMFQHMSNAYTAVENPGLDSHMIHVAYSFPFRFRHGH